MSEQIVRKQTFRGKVAVIPGGSKGIGRAAAREFVMRGGSVCVIARGKDALKQTRAELESLRTQGAAQFVETISADTTDMKKLKPALEKFIKQKGVPDYLINCVGYAYPQYIEKMSLADFQKNMDINYYGQLVPILIMLPHFMKEKRGHIANVSSMMGYFGIMGYAAYAPTKFALVGLTEVLRHELKPYNIACSILYPPDTDTPGYEVENRTKPKECAIMSEKAKLMSADDVGAAFIEGIIKKRFSILPGEAGLIWRIFRHFPGLVRWIIDGDYTKARKRIGRKI